MQQNLQYRTPHPFEAVPELFQLQVKKKKKNLSKALLWLILRVALFLALNYTQDLFQTMKFKNKVTVGEILAADDFMAEKGFDIGDQVKKTLIWVSAFPHSLKRHSLRVM